MLTYYLLGKHFFIYFHLKRLTTEVFKKKLKITHPNLELLSSYKRTNEKITVRCTIHNHQYETTPHRLVQKHNCIYCYRDRNVGKLRKNTQQLLNELIVASNNRYQFPNINSEYKNNKCKITAICPKHGEFKISINKLLQGQGCKKCAVETSANKKKLSEEELLQRFRKVHNEKYTYVDLSKVYKNIYSKIKIVCPIHGEFQQTVNDHLSGCGCPRCSESRLERDVANYLESSGVIFERQKTFHWLGKQRLDFYLPDYGVAIECQGKQHFKPVEYFGGENQFKLIQKRDLKKNTLCKENNVKLFYIVDDKLYNDDFDNHIYNVNNVISLNEFIRDKTPSFDMPNKHQK